MKQLIALLSAIVTLSFQSTAALAAETVKVALFSWPSYGFWFIAKEKNLAPDLNLDIKLIEDPYEIYSQMAAGKIDVASSTSEYAVIATDQKIPIKFVAYTDISYGTDKIIVSPGINSAKDLVGKSVAVLEGGLTQIYLAVWLDKNGVKFNQVKYVNVIMDDAVAAMVNGDVKAAAVWEPFGGNILSNVKGSKVLATSLEKSWVDSALITDGMYMAEKFANDKPKLAAKAMKAYWDAVAYWKTHPDEANAIIAKNLHFPIKDVVSVIGNDGKPKAGGLAVFDYEDAANYLGIRNGLSPLGLPNGKGKDTWNTTQFWWKKFGLVKRDNKFADGVNLAPMSALAK